MFAISSVTETYLFSGKIRNYFLKNYHTRDLKLVVESHDDLDQLLPPHQFRKNSFGGYKILVADMEIDLWQVDKTWAITSDQTAINFQLERYIPYTAFFNFSAVLYFIRERRFLCAKPFLVFFRDKTIDVVYRPNANSQLCVVNIFYYSARFKLKLSSNLKNLIAKIYTRESKNYTEVQIRHFGTELYSSEEIRRRIIVPDI